MQYTLLVFFYKYGKMYFRTKNFDHIRIHQISPQLIYRYNPVSIFSSRSLLVDDCFLIRKTFSTICDQGARGQWTNVLRRNSHLRSRHRSPFESPLDLAQLDAPVFFLFTPAGREAENRGSRTGRERKKELCEKM